MKVYLRLHQLRRPLRSSTAVRNRTFSMQLLYKLATAIFQIVVLLLARRERLGWTCRDVVMRVHARDTVCAQSGIVVYL